MTPIDAMKQALEALENAEADGNCEYGATDLLRTAIEQAEKQEPAAWRKFDGEGGYEYRSYELNEDYGAWWDERNPNHKGWVEPLYTAPPQRQPDYVWCSCGDGIMPNTGAKCGTCASIDAAPPQRQPLTEEEIAHLWETIYDHGQGKYQGDASRAQRERAFAIIKKIGGGE